MATVGVFLVLFMVAAEVTPISSCVLGEYVAGDDCVSFRQCGPSGLTDPIQCPSGLRFSPSINVCVWPGTPEDKCNKPVSCVLGEYVASDDCKSFRQCGASGLTDPIQCPDGLRFSFSTKVCVWPGSLYDDCTNIYSDEEIATYCEANPDTLILPDRECQQYYNCSYTFPWEPRYNPLRTRHSMECSYPNLFSTETGTCEKYSDVNCRKRKEFKYECDYKKTTCLAAHCIPCSAMASDCRNMADGVNVATNKPWTPVYAVCESERSVGPLQSCKKHDNLFPKIFSPETNQCEVLYNIPSGNGGFRPACENEEDGDYPSLEGHPQYYFTCEGGIFVGLNKCEDDKYFNAEEQTCN